MLLYFTKMQGLGNDYIYVDCTKTDMAWVAMLPTEQLQQMAIDLSRLHTGIGADGLILIEPSLIADCRMRMLNADGSFGRMCGNGLRCVARYAWEHGIAKQRAMYIETDSGIRQAFIRGGEAAVNTAHAEAAETAETAVNTVHAIDARMQICVDMGGALNEGEAQLLVAGHHIPAQFVSVGNQHCVLFDDAVRDYPLVHTGSIIQQMDTKNRHLNVEVAKIIDATHIRMRVFEYGSGETMACGTGACAVCAAAVWQGYVHYDENIQIEQPGGTLTVAVLADGRVWMTGTAETVFEGKLDYEIA